jgi:DNA-binding winged helix-turn-helix (wHTH) protein
MPDDPTESRVARRYRFGLFEADASTGELRRQGMRVKINAQPFQLLCILLERPGELVTREEIARTLWPDGMFVDFEHGVNSAVNRIREALGDAASSPRFVETLARRGYRFVAPVELVASVDRTAGLADGKAVSSEQPAAQSAEISPRISAEPDPGAGSDTGIGRDSTLGGGILATPEELPTVSHPVVQTLFILFQAMYLAFYIGALANLAEIDGLLSDLLSPPWRATIVFDVLIVTAAILIPVRAFVLTATVFRAPAFAQKFLKLWPFLLLFDELWSLAPFLLLHHINFGLALACTTLLVYSPFAQRSLVLMGAGGAKMEASSQPDSD